MASSAEELGPDGSERKVYAQQTTRTSRHPPLSRVRTRLAAVESSTPTWDVGYTTNPEMYGLSEQLSQDDGPLERLLGTAFRPLPGVERPRES